MNRDGVANQSQGSGDIRCNCGSVKEVNVGASGQMAQLWSSGTHPDSFGPVSHAKIAKEGKASGCGGQHRPGPFRWLPRQAICTVCPPCLRE